MAIPLDLLRTVMDAMMRHEDVSVVYCQGVRDRHDPAHPHTGYRRLIIEVGMGELAHTAMLEEKNLENAVIVESLMAPRTRG